METVLLKQLEFLTSYQTSFISSWGRTVISCSPPHGLTCLDFRRHRNIPSSRIESSNGRVLFRKALSLHVFRDLWGFPSSPVGKESTCNAGDPGWIPGSGSFPWRKDRPPTPVFLLRIPTDIGTWRATVDGVAKSLT